MHFISGSDFFSLQDVRGFLPEASVALGTSWESAVDWDCLPMNLQHPV